MADVNEEIVAQYLKLVKKWLYAVDISFIVPQNYSNVDLLAFDPASGTYYDIEVKYRSAFTIPATDRNGNDISNSSVQWLVEQFTGYPEREKVIKQYTNNQRTTKVLVTTKQMMGKKNAKRKKLEAAFKKGLAKAGFRNSEIWYFDEMIPEIVDQVGMEGRYNTELLQTIRMLKVYGSQRNS
jgi:hypothetical protein